MFEVCEHCQVLRCLRLGESYRAIARGVLMGREKASACLRAYTHRQAPRDVAGRERWLDASRVLPDDATLAQVLQAASSRPQSVSSVLPCEDKVTA